MASNIDHRCRLLGAPLKGVYFTDIDSARHYGKHWHATFGVGLLERGAQRSASGRGQVDAYAGDLITTNPGEVHDGRPLGYASRHWRMMYLDPAVIASMLADPLSDGEPDTMLTQPVIRNDALQSSLRELLMRVEQCDGARQPTSVDTLACEESLVRTCALLINSYSTSALVHEVSADVRQVRDRLADDSGRPPSLGELAAMVGLSKYQTLRRFEKAYGVPPHSWLLQRRAELVRVLIRDGQSLAQAAAAGGFADQSHMTRVFARQFGFTPGAWRKVVGR